MSRSDPISESRRQAFPLVVGPWLATIGLVSVGMLLKWGIDKQFESEWFTGAGVTIQICIVALVAWRYRTRHAVAALILTVLGLDLFIFEPKLTLTTSNPEEFNQLARFTVIALVLVVLQYRAKQNEAARIDIYEKLLQATRRIATVELRLETALNALTDPLTINQAVRNEQGEIIDFEIIYLNRAASIWNNVQFPERLTAMGRRLNELGKRVGGIDLLEDFKRVVAGDAQIVHEIPVRPTEPGKPTLYFDMRLHKLEDGVVVQWRDITSIKQSEVAMRESEERLLLINESLEMRVRERTRELEARSSQLRALALDLTETESRERKRLAQILHDHFQQLVSAAKLKVGILRRKSGESGLIESMRQVEELLAEAIEASRTLATELSPPILHDAGLGPGLDWLARRMEQDHNLSITVETEPECEPDNEQIRTILFECARELLFNVVKHAGVKQTTLKLFRHEGLIHLVVSDQGVGFDPNQIEASAKHDGSFGLFSIRERITLVGGLANVRSAPGRGTSIELTVPIGIRAQEDNRVLQPALPAGPPVPTDPIPSIRVMVADDHKLFREGLISLLTTEPIVEIVGQAGDGAEALEMARDLKPDVLFMDISMPRLNGVQVTQLLSRELPEIRIIGLSMHERDDMAKAMLNAGARAYLTKGGSPDALFSVLRSVATGNI